MAASATHMLTILHRMKLGNNKTLQLSPSAILSTMTEDGISYPQVKNVVTKGIGGGLEELDPILPIYEVARNFEYKSDKRYDVADLTYVTGTCNIICTLRQNFDSGGRRYPILALCNRMGSLSRHEHGYGEPISVGCLQQP